MHMLTPRPTRWVAFLAMRGLTPRQVLLVAMYNCRDSWFTGWAAATEKGKIKVCTPRVWWKEV